ncbi:MAG: Flp pilus assembly complex ATPase component TadA [Pigmentiphaga sp.]|nr:Flp pilus assembly complex ATPase component TadA [Pigmentiphaga sp.]
MRHAHGWLRHAWRRYLPRPRIAPEPPAAGAGGIVHLEGQDALDALDEPVQRVLSAHFDIGAGAERFCPVQFRDGRVGVLVAEGWQDSDQVRELERLIRAAGHVLAANSRLVVPAPLLLAMARGQWQAGRQPPATAGSGERRRHMAAAFLDLVTWGFDHDASDLHINVHQAAAESEVRYSVAGRYVAPERFARMPTATLQEILAVAWMDVQGGNGAVFDPRIEQQGRLRMRVRGRPVMLRWASLATDAGPSVCLRLLRLDARAGQDLAALGYLPQQVATLHAACGVDGGAIVLAGVVGSGKSTTIATLMSRIPDSHKVITLEDPVEYLIPGALQNTVARALDDTEGGVFDAKLKTIKRSAMNDLLVGEIRDRDTGRALMDLAGSGINLFTTVHAGSALLIADRLASDFIGIPRDFLATPGILKLLVYQALLPALCPICAVPAEGLEGRERIEAEAARRRFARSHGVAADRLRFRHSPGCAQCRREGLPELAGLAGRTVVAEMIEPASDEGFLANLRLADNLAQRRLWRAQRVAAIDQPDMRGKSAADCAAYKVARGLIDIRDAEDRFGAWNRPEERP